MLEIATSPTYNVGEVQRSGDGEGTMRIETAHGRGSRRGAAAGELAIVAAPVLALVLVIGTDFARLFNTYLTVTRKHWRLATEPLLWLPGDGSRQRQYEHQECRHHRRYQSIARANHRRRYSHVRRGHWLGPGVHSGHGHLQVQTAF